MYSKGTSEMLTFVERICASGTIMFIILFVSSTEISNLSNSIPAVIVPL